MYRQSGLTFILKNVVSTSYCQRSTGLSTMAIFYSNSQSVSVVPSTLLFSATKDANMDLVLIKTHFL